MIYEVKLKETMGIVFQELVKMSAIENKLVGTVKLANEEQTDDYNSVDKSKVKLMNNAGGADGTVDDTGGPRRGRRSRGLEGQAASAGRSLARSRPAIREHAKASAEDHSGCQRCSTAPATAPPQ